MRFGAFHVPLDERGRRDVAALRTSGGVVFSGAIRCGPESSTVETVGLLGGEPDVDEALRSLDVGRWDGMAPEDVPVEQLAEWFADPSSTPHGGESVAAFVDRIARWRAGVGAPTVVVAKPVAQALLCAGVGGFFRTEVRPATHYEGR